MVVVVVVVVVITVCRGDRRRRRLQRVGLVVPVEEVETPPVRCRVLRAACVVGEGCARRGRLPVWPSVDAGDVQLVSTVGHQF
eukprot:COSAG01_NODE_41756_length_447_cov_2.801724_1_plen_82_part_10